MIGVERMAMHGNLGFGYVDADFPRPDERVLERLRAAAAADVTDAQGRTGVMEGTIKPLHPDMRVVGPALTVDLPAGDNLMLYVALKIARPGDVLVVNTGGYMGNAIWGELMTHTAKALGIAGLVVDGCVRDTAPNRTLGFPIFCKGSLPVACEKQGPGFVNGSISCGGVVVRPGDIVVGDADGVVVVQRENIETVLAGLEKLAENEEKRLREITSGEKILPDWLDRALEEKGFRLTQE